MPHRSLLPRLLLGAGLCFLFMLTGMGINRLAASAYPRFGEAAVWMGERKKAKPSGMPVSILNAPVQSARVRVDMELVHPEWNETFLVMFTKELDALTVNGHEVEPSPRVDLHGLLTEHNVIEASLSSTTAYTVHFFGLTPSILTSSFILRPLAIVLLSGVGAWVFSFLLAGRLRREILVLIVAGALLRGLYMSATLPIMRTYDWTGHIEYIRSLSEQFALPSQFSWESQQPPLYHMLVALVDMLGRLTGVPRSDRWLDIQFVSLLLSILTLIVGARCLTKLLPSRMSAFIACAIIAAFPGLIFFSSQLSNDTLLTFLGFLWFESLLRAWHSGRDRDWLLTSAWVGVGLLTKGNALLWGVVTLACIVFQHSSVTDRFRRTVVASGIMIAGCAFFVWRFFEHNMLDPVSNAVRLHPVFHVTTSWTDLVTIHPVSMLLHPFVSGAYPETHPEFFIDSLLKSSQFGSSWYGPGSAVILLLLLFTLPVAAWGFLQECRKCQSFPLIVTAVILFLGLMAFRVVYPYAPSAHFRYIPVILLPFVYLVARGADSIRFFPLRALAETTTLAYAVAGAGLILAITLAS